MYVQAFLLTNGTVAILKTSVGRTRPFVYNPDAPLEEKLKPDARKSFPSGHTATAFVGAVFLGTTHEKLYPGSSANPWVWTGSLLGASAVGYLRYAAGKHYPTDILAGAAIGSLFGWLVPKLHEIDDGPSGQGGSVPLISFSLTF
jgi:membrane-associated phospholipid phosphatase